MKILFCQLRTYGDIIRTFPIISEIKKIYNPYIGFVCFEEMKQTCLINRDIDEVITIERLKQYENNYQDTRIVDCTILDLGISRIVESNYNVYIDFHGVFQSALIGILANIPKRIGRSKENSKDGAYLFYNRKSNIKETIMNKIDLHLLNSKQLYPDLTLPINNKVKDFNEVVIIPGSSTVGVLKRWQLNKYKELVLRLSEKFKLVKVILGPEERNLTDDLIFDKTNIALYNVNNLHEFQKLVTNTSFIIGNDTSFLHMGIYLGIYVFTIFGPTDPIINGAPSYSNGRWISLNLKCTKNCDVWSGICNNQHKCMEELSIDSVYQSFISFCQS